MIRVVAAKLVSYHSFWKFLTLLVAAILFAVYVASSFGDVQVNDSALPIAQWFAPPLIWQTVFAIGRWLYFIPAFFIVQLICSELELRLVRAQVIAGLDRRDVVWGWVLQNALLTLIALPAAVCAALLFASHPTAGNWGLTELLRHGLGFVLYGLVFLNITMLCAALMRRPVPALSLLILWPMVVEPTASYLLGRYGFDSASAYLPFASLGSLVSLPGSDAGFGLTAPMSLVCVAYGAAASVLTWLRLRHMDL